MKETVVLIFLTISLSSVAQRNSGVKFGFSHSWIESTVTDNPQFYDHFKYDPLNSYFLGYSWNFTLGGNSSIQADLIYNSKGAVLVQTDPNYTGFSQTPPYTVNYYPLDNTSRNYFSVPIAYSYMLTAKFFVEVGAEISITINGRNIWDFGVLAGTGYTTKYADISLRYVHGLVNSNPNENSDIVKNRVIQFGVTLPVFKHIKRK